ncbi:hypothetical protein [Streptomyces abyssalis]|uniref:hypothetical protein n=1 Tax=Streptomyces abyssalis TaxID=933944 RepID=UPI001112EFB5|nr:hypothetical protein [Streptomyces abyssalis]
MGHMRHDVDENRRTPEELAVLFDLEPEIKELIVEGRSDAALLRWFFSLTAPEVDLAIFAVQDRVLIESDRVRELGHLPGNRGRVVAAAEIVTMKRPNQINGAFVADRDFSILGLDSCPNCRCLYFTDFTSMELYFFNEKSIKKLLTVTLRAPATIVAADVIESILSTLVNLFKVRAVIRGVEEPTPKLAGKVIDQMKFHGDGSSSLNPEEAIRKSCKGDITGLLEKYGEITIPEGVDVRHFINGHDFSAILIRYLQSVCPQVFREERRPLLNAPLFEIAMLTSAEVADLEGTDLFENLATFVHGGDE